MKKNIRFVPSPVMKVFGRIFSGIFALVGISFVVIGVTEVIPSGAGLFGVVWTLMACFFAGVGIYGVVSKEGLYGMRRGFGIEISDDDGGESSEDRLKKLQYLYDQRLITTEEYEQKRKEILGQL